MAIRFGAPVFLKSQDPAELAAEHKRLGYRAAYCPRPALAENVGDDTLHAVAAAFKKENVVIAEVGAWCNAMHPDPAIREKNLRLIISRLDLAERLGALCAVDYAGSFSPQYPAGPHLKDLSQEAFDLAVENTRKIIHAVKPKRAKFCLEMMPWAWPDSPDTYLAMIKAVDRPALAVHFDATNLINCWRHYYDTAAVINECIRKLGPMIVSAHAKDVTMAPESLSLVNLRETRPGTGNLDYRALLKGLASLPHEVPLMMEHLKTVEDYAAAAHHIRNVAQDCGVSL